MNEIKTFEQAVEYCVKYFSGWQKFESFPGFFPQISPDSLKKRISATTILELLRIHPDNEAVLVQAAKTNAECFDALRYACATMLNSGSFYDDELSKPYLDIQHYQYLRLWLSDYLFGKIERPYSKTGRKSASGLHSHIYMLIEKLVSTGVLEFRNDDKNGDNTSACDAVAVALKTLGLTPKTYGGVKKIYLNERKKCTSGGVRRGKLEQHFDLSAIRGLKTN